MPLGKLVKDLEGQLAELTRAGTGKGAESVVAAVRPARGGRGPRFLLEGLGEREFIRMNSNSYLGLTFRPELAHAEETAARQFGVGPGAVRFISGTYSPHLRLEAALASFHSRPAAMAAGSAYTAVAGVLFSLSTPETAIISDELNHNCIVNGMKLARAKARKIYPHLDLAALERHLEESVGQCESVLVITDGVFSMRGDHAPDDRIQELVDSCDGRFPKGALLVADDSPGVGAFGATGRGTEEITSGRADVLVGTLGKAFCVHGGVLSSGPGGVTPPRREKPPPIVSQVHSPRGARLRAA